MTSAPSDRPDGESPWRVATLVTAFVLAAASVSSGTTASQAATDSDPTVFSCAEGYGVARVIYDIDRRAQVAYEAEIVDQLWHAVQQLFPNEPPLDPGIESLVADVEMVYEDAETVVYVAAEGAVEFGLTTINDSAVPQYLAVCGSLADTLEDVA